MTGKADDYQQFMEQKRFLSEIEQGIRFANREIIHKHIPHLSKDKVLALAVAVGKLRAGYLEAAFRLGDANAHGNPPDAARIADLKAKREAFSEAKTAFEALLEAIEKGYVDMAVEPRGE